MVDVSSSVWTGQIQQVNFIGDVTGVSEFLCADLPQDVVDMLWSQLPDESGGSQDILVVLGAEPTLPLPLPLLCVDSSEVVPLQD